MNCNELMIGDWVMYNPNVFIEDEYESPQKTYPTQIMSGEDIDIAIEGCYESIPLTAEILEKNGFQKNKISNHETLFYIEQNYDFLYIRDVKIPEFDIGNSFDEEGELHTFITIKYVHELQHALRLCGFNDLADNFKI